MPESLFKFCWVIIFKCCFSERICPEVLSNDWALTEILLLAAIVPDWFSIPPSISKFKPWLEKIVPDALFKLRLWILISWLDNSFPRWLSSAPLILRSRFDCSDWTVPSVLFNDCAFTYTACLAAKIPCWLLMPWFAMILSESSVYTVPCVLLISSAFIPSCLSTRSLPALLFSWVTFSWALPAALITPELLFNVCATFTFNCPLASLWSNCPCWWLSSTAFKSIFCADVSAWSKLAMPRSSCRWLLLWILPCCPCRFCAVIFNCWSPACKISPATEFSTLVLITVPVALLIICPALLSIWFATSRIKSFLPVCWIKPWLLFNCAVLRLTCFALYCPFSLTILCIAVKSSCSSAIIFALLVFSWVVAMLIFLAWLSLWLKSAVWAALICNSAPAKIFPASWTCCASIFSVASVLLSFPSWSRPATHTAFLSLTMVFAWTVILFCAANWPCCCNWFTVKSALLPA